MHRITKAAAVAATTLVALGVAGAAHASVTFDPATGTGFVGKGDVQVPFGWNDAKLQTNAPHVTFTYEKHSTEEYEAVCVWYIERTDVWFEGQGPDKIKHTEVVQVRHDQDKHAKVDAKVSFDPKSASRMNPNGKVTGFNLLGFDQASTVTESTGSVPVVGAPCPATGNEAGTDSAVDKTIESVTELSSTSVENLSANFDGGQHSIWPPAPVIADPATTL